MESIVCRYMSVQKPIISMFRFFDQVGVETRVFKPCCVGGKYEKEAFFGTWNS